MQISFLPRFLLRRQFCERRDRPSAGLATCFSKSLPCLFSFSTRERHPEREKGGGNALRGKGFPSPCGTPTAQIKTRQEEDQSQMSTSTKLPQVDDAGDKAEMVRAGTALLSRNEPHPAQTDEMWQHLMAGARGDANSHLPKRRRMDFTQARPLHRSPGLIPVYAKPCCYQQSGGCPPVAISIRPINSITPWHLSHTRFWIRTRAPRLEQKLKFLLKARARTAGEVSAELPLLLTPASSTNPPA